MQLLEIKPRNELDILSRNAKGSLEGMLIFVVIARKGVPWNSDAADGEKSTPPY